MAELAPLPLASFPLAPEAALAPSVEPLVAGLDLATLPPRTSLRVQLGRRAIAHAGAVRVRGHALPTAPNTCIGDDPVLWWTAPDGWLVTSARDAAGGLAAEIRAECAEHLAAVVDVSDSLVTFALEGAAWRELLARGTGIDLRPHAFGPGQCVRTRLVHYAVLLRPTSAHRVEVVVDRALAASLHEWFVDAARGLASG